MTTSDAAYAMEELGIRLVVDLRNPDEADRDGRGPLPGLASLTHTILCSWSGGFPPFTGGDVVERLSST